MNAIRRTETQAEALRLVGRPFFEGDYRDVPGYPLPFQTPDLGVANRKLGRGLVVHERAATLAAGQKALRFEQVERLAHGA